MKSIWICVLLFCGSTISITAQVQDVNMFIFGHSLIDHRPPAIPTPSDESTVPHWIEDIATQQGNNFAAGGQFGFLPQHANLPPVSQLGYDNVEGVWESDYETFAETDINTILMTAANFIQFTPADQPHPIGYSTTAVDATLEIIDWITAQRGEDVKYYIYANWPEMDLQNAYPPNLPSELEVESYHDLTQSIFIDWWTEYQDFVLDRNPESEIRLIPVGPIISGVITNVLEGQVPFEEWYEDSAPHGRSNLYYLASLITYMSIYEERVDDNITVDPQIHPAIRNNMSSVIDYIWTELQAFNFGSGESRVFLNTPVNTAVLSTRDNSIIISPNPVGDFIQINKVKGVMNYEIVSLQGATVLNGDTSRPIDVSFLHAGLYFLKLSDKTSTQQLLKFVKL